MKRPKHKRTVPRTVPASQSETPKAGVPSAKTKQPRLWQAGWAAAGGLALLAAAFFAFKKPPSGAAPDGPVPKLIEIASAVTHVSPAKQTNSAQLRLQAEVNDLNAQANRLLAGGKADQAIAVYQKALALTPADETLHFNLGVAFGQAGESTNAEQEYKEALRLLPDYAEAHNNYGNLLVHSGRLAEADVQLSQAVEETPESASFQNSLGVLRQRLKRTNEAMACFQKAVQCDSNCWQAHLNLALAYELQQKRESAIAELREALRINPNSELARRVLARATGADSSGTPP